MRYLDILWVLPVIGFVLLLVLAYHLGIERGKDAEQKAQRIRQVEQYRATRRP